MSMLIIATAAFAGDSMMHRPRGPAASFNVARPNKQRHSKHSMIFAALKKLLQTTPPPDTPDSEAATGATLTPPPQANTPASADDLPYVLAALAAGCGATLGLLLLAILQRISPALVSAPLPGFLLGLLPFQLMACGAAALTLRAGISGQSLWFSLGLPDSLDLPRAMFRRVLGQLLILYPALVLVNLCAIAVCQRFGWPTPEQTLTQYARQDCGAAFWIVAALSVALIAPVCEELLFRQVIFRSIRYFSPRYAGLGTALLFSLFHGLPQYAPTLFILGLFLQRARNEGGLPQAIVLHSLFNLISLLFIVLIANAIIP